MPPNFRNLFQVEVHRSFCLIDCLVKRAQFQRLSSKTAISYAKITVTVSEAAALKKSSRSFISHLRIKMHRRLCAPSNPLLFERHFLQWNNRPYHTTSVFCQFPSLSLYLGLGYVSVVNISPGPLTHFLYILGQSQCHVKHFLWLFCVYRFLSKF